MQYIVVRYTIASETFDHEEIDYLFVDDSDTFLDLMNKLRNFSDVFIHEDIYANVYQYSIPIFNAIQKLKLAGDIIAKKFTNKHVNILLHFIKLRSNKYPVSSVKFSIIPNEI